MPRLYHVVAVNEKTGKISLCGFTSVTHEEGCILMKRFTPHPARRIQLMELSAWYNYRLEL